MIVVGEVPAGKESRPLHERPETKTFREIRERGSLRVIVNSYTPRLAFRETDSSPIRGFEIDLATDLCGRIFGEEFIAERHLELVEAPNAEKIDMLRRHDVDVIIANMTVTPDRCDEIDFCGHYFSAWEAPLLGPGVHDVKEVADLTDLRVAVEADSSSAQMLKRIAPDLEVIPMDDPSNWLVALRNGEIDAIIGDTLYNSVVMETSNEFREAGLRLEPAHAAVGIAKGREDLRVFINEWMAELLSNGRLLTLQKRWKLS